MENTNYTPIYTRQQLNVMKVKDLRKQAAKINLKHYRTFHKNDLINAILIKQKENNSAFKELEDIEETDVDLSDLTLEDSSFSNFILRYSYTPTDLFNLTDIVQYLYPKLLKIASSNENYKISIDIKATFSANNVDYDDIEFTLYSRRYSKYESDKESRIIKDLNEAIELKDTQGSGWKIVSINKVILNVTRITQLKGASFVELPKFIQDKKAVLNIQNRDNRCFLYSIIANLFPAETNRSSPYSYTNYLDRLDISMLKFPVKVDSSIDKFEELNNLSINIYTLEGNIIVPAKISLNVNKQYEKLYNEMQRYDVTNESTIREKINDLEDVIKKHTNFINLFLYEGHYSLITSMSKLMYKQLNDRKSNHRYYICNRCLNYCRSPTKFFHHLRFCIGNKASEAIVNLPVEGSTLKFTKHKARIELPFVAYYDFECMFQNLQESDNQILNGHINALRHKPIAAGYTIISRIPNVKPTSKTFYGLNTSYQFVDNLIKTLVTDENSIYKTYYRSNYRFKVPKPPSSEQPLVCHICEKSFMKSDTKVIDHCHFTGKFRGYAHQDCNINFKSPDFIPIIAHNSSKYDSHLFIKELCNYPGVEVKFIPVNEETSIAFSAYVDCYQYKDKKTGENKTKRVELRFLDSIRFMNTSLDKLTANLTNHKYLESLPYDTNLLKRKGIYPYEYMNSTAKFSETKLPPIESFYSKLRAETVSLDDYKYANEVWTKLNIQNLLDYTLVYLQTDIMHLADIFETFRDTCITNYKLDPCHFYTSPGLSWDAMLYLTNVSLDLVTEQSILEFFESQVRGGVSTIFHRYAEANNPYLNNYDPAKPRSYINHIDATNLYGWAMSQKLPTGNFKWLSENQIQEKFKILIESIQNYQLNSNTGIVYEVDIEYPEFLHDYHSDYPVLPEVININGTPKLIPNLRNKKYYILNEANLVQAIKLGLKLTKIYRAISFDQSNWLQQYIDKNTELRKNAVNDFEKDFFKLMNNSVFGKTMENVRKRSNLEILNDNPNVENYSYTLKKLAKLVNKPNYKEPKTIFNSNIKIFHFTKTKIIYNKPIYVGAQILDISKTLMYHFHYSYMKQKFPKQRTLFTDTDCITYQIFTEDFYKEIAEDCKEIFDTSSYVKPIGNIPLNVNKKVPGKFKDETGNDIISHFAGNRAKSYSMMTNNDVNTTKKVLKGITAASRKAITFQDYVNCILSRQQKLVDMTTFENREHNIYTVTRNKIALDAEDDKRVILSDNISTLPYGHWRLNSN